MSPTLHVYDFGEKAIWPKPELKTPWDAMRAYHDLQQSVGRLHEYAAINGRADHYVKNLDTLAYALREALFQTMVIREALTGFNSRASEWNPNEDDGPAPPGNGDPGTIDLDSEAS